MATGIAKRKIKNSKRENLADLLCSAQHILFNTFLTPLFKAQAVSWLLSIPWTWLALDLNTELAISGQALAHFLYTSLDIIFYSFSFIYFEFRNLLPEHDVLICNLILHVKIYINQIFHLKMQFYLTSCFFFFFFILQCPHKEPVYSAQTLHTAENNPDKLISVFWRVLPRQWYIWLFFT